MEHVVPTHSQQLENESCHMLLTPPHCIAEVGDVVAVEGALLHSVPVPDVQKKSQATESHFGAEEANMQEMEDRKGRDPITHVMLKTNGEGEVQGGFDVCNEYGYKYAYSAEDDDDDSDGPDFTNQSLPGVPLLSLEAAPVVNSLEDSVSSRELSQVIYLLGKTYDAIHDYAPRRSDESSLFWFTYRFDFPEIVPYRITTDAGWGCMLRSAQMMLGQALRMHYKGRNWRPPQAIAQRRHDKFMVKIMNWFADFPSRTECFFSLHNMVAAGLSKYETLPGEWYGPAKASYVMRDLCQLFEERHSDNKNEGSLRAIFRVHVASQGTVYRDAVNDLMTKDQKESLPVAEQQAEPVDRSESITHPLDPVYSVPSRQKSLEDLRPWDTALLLLVPLRLGLQNFNIDYTLQLARIFSFEQSVGVLGGRPRGARWFYGATSDGVKLYGLDPHTIQGCPQRRMVKLPNGQKKPVVAMTEDYLRSIHTTNPECINLNRLDPSLALGFYCKDRDDFNALCSSVQKLKTANPSLPEIFSVADNVPDYSANVSSVMNEMMAMSVNDLNENEDDADDEDDYVLL